jgi:hypothetical protein
MKLKESEIKQALEKGFITHEEAKEMLLVYLNKANFTPIQNKSIILHYVA